MRDRCAWMVGSLMALAMSSAWGAGGQVGFSGAVVVPTCVAQAEAMALTTANSPSGRLYACGGRPEEGGVVDAATYVLSTQRLDDATTAGTPLLQYLVGDHAAAHAAAERMLTRVYQ